MQRSYTITTIIANKKIPRERPYGYNMYNILKHRIRLYYIHTILLISFVSYSCSSNPNTCDTYNPFKNDSQLFDSPNTKSCKRELELCRMDNYKKQVDLNTCKENKQLYLNIALAIVGAISGFLSAKLSQPNTH